ncbi:hypothetical protein BH24ACT4_BH24ACT4_17060 [soil metagenome]
MCGECWNAAMAAPMAFAAGRFAWVGYRDRLPMRLRRSDGTEGGPEGLGLTGAPEAPCATAVVPCPPAEAPLRSDPPPPVVEFDAEAEARAAVGHLGDSSG